MTDQQWRCSLQGPGFESHLLPVEFFSCKKVSPLPQSNPNANICAMRPNCLARGYQGLHVKKVFDLLMVATLTRRIINMCYDAACKYIPG